jgi:hypothetical protein
VSEKQQKADRTGRLEPSRLAHPQAPPQGQAQVEARNVNQQPFRDVVPTSQVDPAHAAGVVAVGEAAFQDLTSAAQQPLAPFAANPPAVGVGGSPFCGLAAPASAAALAGLGG